MKYLEGGARRLVHCATQIHCVLVVRDCITKTFASSFRICEILLGVMNSADPTIPLCSIAAHGSLRSFCFLSEDQESIRNGSTLDGMFDGPRLRKSPLGVRRAVQLKLEESSIWYLAKSINEDLFDQFDAHLRILVTNSDLCRVNAQN